LFGCSGKTKKPPTKGHGQLDPRAVPPVGKNVEIFRVSPQNIPNFPIANPNEILICAASPYL
jgi:hypothetical protein